VAVGNGLLPTDRYSVNKADLEIRSTEVSRKDGAYVPNFRDGGTRFMKLPRSQRTDVCLTMAQIRELAVVGRSLEDRLGGPQDIEWAFTRRSSGAADLYLLQARPEAVPSKNG